MAGVVIILRLRRSVGESDMQPQYVHSYVHNINSDAY